VATKTWIGNALDRKQINTITVANTWATGDTATMTINGKDLIVTVGATGTSTANVAIALKEAWMSATRSDGTGTPDATSNAGGQEFGEFAEMTATVSGSVVTLIANTAGNPITLTVTEATATTGTATLATPQAATGREFWSDADNWDSGTVPASDDIVVFRDSDVSCRYGLPNGSLEVTIQQWMSYTGEIGLPEINRNDPRKPYHEYRQRYVRLDDAGAGTDIAHRFGLGKDGVGSTLINLKHSTLKCSPIVYNTGKPLVSRVGTKALNICCTANTSILKVVNGSVDFSSQDGGTSAFVSFTQNAGDTRGVEAIYTSGAGVNVYGGYCVLGQAGAINIILVKGGTLRLEGQTGTIANVGLYSGGILEYVSTATITTLIVHMGTFDARGDSGGFTVGTGSMYAGSKWHDPYQRMTVSGNFFLYFNPSPDLDFGANVGSAVTLSY